MTTAVPAAPTLAQMALLRRRVTLTQYRQLFDIGVFTDQDRLELLDGYIVEKPVPNPPHSVIVGLLTALLLRALPPGWTARFQDVVVLPADGAPQPDAAVIRGTQITYAARHPGPADIGLVVEVADSTLRLDRVEKCRLYARDGLPVYWIVNVNDAVVEVYSDPDPATAAYRARADYRPGDAVPLVLDGAEVARVSVSDIIP